MRLPLIRFNYLRSKPPIFIVGCSHSGTTLLRALLGTHSQIYEVPNESGIFLREPYCDTTSVKDNIPVLTKCIWLKRANEQRKCRWVEKTPNHIFFIGDIMERIPDAKIVIIHRDGRDVTCGMKRRGHVFGPWTNDFIGATEKWVDTVNISNKFAGNSCLYTLRYEDLISNTSSQLAQLCHFLDEHYEPQMLRFYERKDKKEKGSYRGLDIQQYRHWQVSQPIFDGRGVWRREMEPFEKKIFKERAGKLLIELGYAIDMNW